MKLSVVIPARDEVQNIGACLERVCATLDAAGDIPYELVVIDDNSSDGTAEVVAERARSSSAIRLVRRGPPSGFGRAIRSGLAAASGDVVAVFMADLCDDSQDLVAYYRKIEEGYDCVFGSRFVSGASVGSYPLTKLVLNRLGNHAVRLLFSTELNDLTNAFKAYRAGVLRECGPLRIRPLRHHPRAVSERAPRRVLDRSDTDPMVGTRRGPVEASNVGDGRTLSQEALHNASPAFPAR